MENWAEIEESPSFQARDPGEQWDIRNDFFTTFLEPDPDYEALAPEEQETLKNDFIGEKQIPIEAQRIPGRLERMREREEIPGEFGKFGAPREAPQYEPGPFQGIEGLEPGVSLKKGPIFERPEGPPQEIPEYLGRPEVTGPEFPKKVPESIKIAGKIAHDALFGELPAGIGYLQKPFEAIADFLGKYKMSKEEEQAMFQRYPTLMSMRYAAASLIPGGQFLASETDREEWNRSSIEEKRLQILGETAGWALAPAAFKLAGDIAVPLLKKIPWLDKPIGQLIKDSTWWRQITNKERGLVVQTIEDMKRRGLTDAQILKALRGNPEQFYKFRAEEIQKRRGPYAPPPETPQGPVYGPPPGPPKPYAPGGPPEALQPPPVRGKGPEEPLPPIELGAPEIYKGPERRADLAFRKKIAQMTPEEQQEILLTDELTGLRNRRAFDIEDERMPHQAYVDADSLKWINDNLGHDVGDQVLQAIAKAIKPTKGAKHLSYRMSGDEFIIQGPDRATVEQAIESASKSLENVTLEYTAPDGTKYTKKGVEITYGLGETKPGAEEQLRRAKVEREKAGFRAARGEEPPGVAKVTSTGRQIEGGEGPGLKGVPKVPPARDIIAITRKQYEDPLTLVDKRINEKYADILALPEEEFTGSIYQRISDREVDPKELDKYLTKIKNNDVKVDIIRKMKITVADEIADDLIKTYKYETIEDGKELEEYFDSILKVIKEQEGHKVVPPVKVPHLRPADKIKQPTEQRLPSSPGAGPTPEVPTKLLKAPEIPKVEAEKQKEPWDVTMQEWRNLPVMYGEGPYWSVFNRAIMAKATFQEAQGAALRQARSEGQGPPPTEEERKAVLARMDKSLARMAETVGKDDPYYKSFLAKREAIAAGGSWAIKDVTEETVRGIGGEIGRLTKATGLRRPGLEKPKELPPEVTKGKTEEEPEEAPEFAQVFHIRPDEKLSLKEQEELLREAVDEAIRNAPEMLHDMEKPQGKVKFVLPSGTTYIVPTLGTTAIKQDLEAFKKAIKGLGAPFLKARRKPTKASLPKPSAGKRELVGELFEIEDGGKGWFTDGHLAVKGTPPHTRMLPGRVVTWEALKEHLEVPGQEPASLRYYSTTSPEGDIGISKEPIAILGETGRGVGNQVIFKVGKRRRAFDMLKFNVIRNRYPEATYKIGFKGEGKDATPLLIAYVKGEPVGMLSSLAYTGEKHIPAIKMAGKAGYADVGGYATFHVKHEIPPIFKPPRGTADVGGYATNLPKIIEMPEIVEIAEFLLKGKYPAILKRLRGKGWRGAFYHGGEVPRIKLMAEIFQNPGEAAAVLSHEIGHLADWLPDKTLSRGNILGRIASLKRYMKQTLPRAPGVSGELTAEDRIRLRKQAILMLKAENKDLMIDQVIKKTFPVSPQDVLNIWNSLDPAAKNKDLEDYIKGLDTALKKAIVKQALKDQVADEIKRFAKVVMVPTGKKIKYKPSDLEIKERYEQLVAEEIRKLRVFEADEMRNELKLLSRAWKPFDPGENPAFTKYRYSGVELYADAFSALINTPQLVKSLAPNWYEGFFNYLERKPGVKAIYDQIQREIQLGANPEKRDRRLIEGFEKREREYGLTIKSRWKDILNKDAWAMTFIDRYYATINRVKKVGESNIPDHLNPRYKIEEMIHTGAEVEGYLTDIKNRILLPLEQENFTPRDLDVYLYHRRVSTERSKLANPLGWTSDLSSAKLKELQDQFPLVKKMADEFNAVRKEWLIDKLGELKMHSPELLKFMVENPNYATFDIVGWADQNFGRIASAHVFRQIGTLRPTGPPFTATILKDIAMMRAANRVAASRAVVKFFKDYYPDEINDAKTQWSGKFHKIVEPKDPEQGLLVDVVDGKAHGYYVPRYVAEGFQKNPVEAWLLSEILRITVRPFKMVFTELNPGFMAYNALKDYRRLARDLPGGSYVNVFKSYMQAIKPAFRSVVGQVDELAKRAFKSKTLISVTDYRADAPEDLMLERMLKRFNIIPSIWKAKVFMPFHTFFYYLSGLGRGLERIPKFAADIYLSKHFPDMPPGEKGHFIRANAGSPAFLRQGTGAPIYNNLWIFSNAQKEGWRGDFEVARKRPAEIAWKVAKYYLLPKLLMFGAALGFLGWKTKQIMDRVSSYDGTNYDIVPIGITPSGKAVVLRVPQDETGRLIGGVFWKLLNREKFKWWSALLDYLAGQAPTLHPMINLIGAVVSYACGKNPYDAFRSRYVIPEQIMLAGGKRAHKIFARWLSDQAGLSVIHRFGSDRPEQIKTDLEKILGWPIVSNIVGRFIKVTDLGLQETLREAKLEVKSIMAEISLTAGEGLEKLLEGEMPSKEEVQALASKANSLPDAALKLLAWKYNHTYVQALLSSQSNAEKAVVIERMVRDYEQTQRYKKQELMEEEPKGSQGPPPFNPPRMKGKFEPTQPKEPLTLRGAREAMKGGK